ncbi:hypothetical protein L0337_20280 [candidate division KSB1 bacterium]|nr:hypothetical protein [candidate division KSB1 bacterium]
MKPKADSNHFILIFLCGSLAFNAFPQSSSQQIGQLKLQKLSEITGEDLKDVAIYAEPSDQSLRPQILVKAKTIEFLTPQGNVRNRVDFVHEFHTTFSTNERYMAVIQKMKIPSKEENGAELFQLFAKDGTLLWQESYSTYWDVHAPIYRISSNSIVCKTAESMGTISFHDQQGAKTAENVLWPDFLRSGLQGEWSQDGRYYAVISPHLRERQGSELRYSDKLTLFDATGTKLWEQILQDKSANAVFISSQSKWAVVSYQDMVSRNWGATIYSVSNGEPITTITLNQFGLTHAIFTRDDEKLLVKAGSYQNPRLVLYESISGKNIFESNIPQPILDLKLLAKDNLIYVLTGERILPQNMERRRRNESIQESKKAQRPTPERSTLGRPRLTNLQLMVLSLNGTILGTAELLRVEAPPNTVMIHSASTSKRFIIKANNMLILYELDF